MSKLADEMSSFLFQPLVSNRIINSCFSVYGIFHPTQVNNMVVDYIALWVGAELGPGSI